MPLLFFLDSSVSLPSTLLPTTTDLVHTYPVYPHSLKSIWDFAFVLYLVPALVFVPVDRRFRSLPEPTIRTAATTSTCVSASSLIHCGLFSPWYTNKSATVCSRTNFCLQVCDSRHYEPDYTRLLAFSFSGQFYRRWNTAQALCSQPCHQKKYSRRTL